MRSLRRGDQARAQILMLWCIDGRVDANSPDRGILTGPAPNQLGTALRRPQSTKADATTMAMPTDINPTVTSVSCHGCPLCPAPVIGERAAVPKIAASTVMNQLK